MESNVSSVHPGFKESLSFKVFKITLYSLILLLCLIGNSMVVFIVCRTKRMRMSSNLLVLNLAICDLITPITSIPFDFALEENDYVWPFGRVLCKTLWPLATLSATAASLTLAMISFDRYRVIMHPFRQRLTSRQIKYSIALTHMMGLLFVIPYAYYLDLAPSSHKCEEAWPAFSYRQAYTLFLFIVQYGIPLVFMTIMYSITLLNLHGSSNKFESTARERLSSSSDTSRPCKISLQVDAVAANGDINGSRLDITRDYRKSSRETIGQRHDVLGRDQNIRATKMFVTVVIVFATCRLPNEIFWLWSDFGDGHQSENSNIAGIICRMFTYTNSIFNPVIYWIFSKDFKRGFKAIFLSFCGRKRLRIWDDDLDQDKNYHKISTLSESLSFVWRKISRSRSESSYNPELRENQGHSRKESTNGRPSNGNVTFCFKESVLNKYGDASDISRKKSSLKTSQSGILPNQNSLLLPSQSKLSKLSEESIYDASEEVLKVKFRRCGTVLPPGKHAPEAECQTIIKITRPLSEIDPLISEGEDCANAIRSTIPEVGTENSQPTTEALLSAGIFSDSKEKTENTNKVCKTQSADKEERCNDKSEISTSVENGNSQPTSESLLSSVEPNNTFDDKKVSLKNINTLEACEAKLAVSQKEDKHMFLGQLNSNLNLNGIKETNC